MTLQKGEKRLTLPKIIEEQPSDLKQLLELIETYEQGREHVWYRGVSRHDYELVPTIARSEKIKTEKDLDDVEKKISAAFSQRSPPFLEKDVDGPWKSMFFMQHYGIPTRLLDWSESPFVSLYFALANVPRKKDGEAASDVALWFCDPIVWNRTSLAHISFQGGVLDETCEELKAYRPDMSFDQKATLPIMIYGTHNSPRIVSQRGVFALFGKSMKGMDNVFKAGKYEEGCLQKARIKAENVDTLLKSLYQKGFSESTIYPDLFGLSLEIRRRFGFS